MSKDNSRILLMIYIQKVMVSCNPMCDGPDWYDTEIKIKWTDYSIQSKKKKQEKKTVSHIYIYIYLILLELRNGI